MSEAAPVIHIGGWPGVGKMTVGRIVADTLGGRLIHNHLMLDAARALYARGTPESIAMREEVRQLMLSHARRLPKDVPVVLTDALADEPAAIPLFQPALDLARDRGAALRIFVLDASTEENQRRLVDPTRLGGAKLMDAEILLALRRRSKLFVPDTAVVIDVTSMTARTAADEICRVLDQEDA